METPDLTKLRLSWLNTKMVKTKKREDSKYETKNHTFGFQQYETIRSFVESIYTGKIVTWFL